MAKRSLDAAVIDWIRKEIHRIRTFIHSQPQREELNEVDTLLSVAESEAERRKAAANDPSRDKAKKPPSGDNGDGTQ